MTYLGMLGPWQILMLLLLFCTLIPTLIALIDILKSEFKGTDKIVWLLVVIFLNILGVILYYAIGRQQKIRKE